MRDTTYPCVIYQRLRPSAAEASEHARVHIWPLVDQVVKREAYSVCGLYGDSEFAPPFCGGSEIRLGFEAALDHARALAASSGNCTLLIGSADQIGDGDPFLPSLAQVAAAEGVHVRVANFYLRSHADSTSLRAAWRYFDEYMACHERKAVCRAPLTLTGSDTAIELIVERDPSQLLAQIYLSNPRQTPMTIIWRQLVLQQQGAERRLSWTTLEVLGGCVGYLDTVFQGEPPWVRQMQVRHQAWDRKVIGYAHVTPSDMLRNRLPLIWEDRG